MKNILMMSALIFFSSCNKSESDNSVTKGSATASLSSVSLSSNTTLFRTASSGEAIKLKKSTLAGAIEQQSFSDTDGETVTNVEVLSLRRLSNRYIVIRIRTTKIQRIVVDDSDLMETSESITTSDGVIDSTDGSLLGITGFFYDIDNLVEFQGYLFGYDPALVTLIRIKLDSGDVLKYLTLSGSETFMLGHRFGVSSTSIFWDDSGSTPTKSPNFVPILVDENLNVLVQVNIGGSYPTRVILPNGTTGPVSSTDVNVGGNGQQPNSGILLAYSDDGKLLRLHSNSGFYSHLWGPSPTPNAVDVTVSSVVFGISGIQTTQLLQIHPFTGLTFTSDNMPMRARSEESLSSNIRTILMGRGVFEINLSNSSNPQVAYTDFATNLGAIVVDTAKTVQYPSLVGSNIYFLNGAKTSILKIDLASHSTTSSVVLTDTAISSFFLVGGNIIYSDGVVTYSFNLTTSVKTVLDANSEAMVTDIISI